MKLILLFLAVAGLAAANDPKPLMTERGRLLASEDLSQMPVDVFNGGALASMSHGWSFRPGQWDIVDGALRGCQLKKDNHSAAAFFALPWKNAVLQFDVKLDGCSQVVFCIDDPAALRPATPTRPAQNRVEHLCRLIINKSGFSTQKDDHDHDGADANEAFGVVKKPMAMGEWKTVLIEVMGEEMVTTIDGRTIVGAHAQVAADKAYISFGVTGYSNGFEKVPPLSASFRDFRLWEAQPAKGWPVVKAKLKEQAK